MRTGGSEVTEETRALFTQDEARVGLRSALLESLAASRLEGPCRIGADSCMRRIEWHHTTRLARYTRSMKVWPSPKSLRPKPCISVSAAGAGGGLSCALTGAFLRKSVAFGMMSSAALQTGRFPSCVRLFLLGLRERPAGRERCERVDIYMWGAGSMRHSCNFLRSSLTVQGSSHVADI